MANRSEHEHRTPEGSGTRGGGVPASRALVVLAAFVLITLLALSQIHTGPSKATSASGSGSAATTTPTTSPSTGLHHRTTTTTTTIPPSAVQVVVFNASEVNGVAKSVSNELHPAGWNMLTPANASETVTASRVYYLPGYRAPAVEIATSLQIPRAAVLPYSSAAPISSMGTAQVAVVVGPDLAARVSSSTSTTTTAASSTTASSTTTTKASSTAG